MKSAARILLVLFGCLLSNQVQSAPSPAQLTEQQTATLSVGELAVLRIPLDRPYTYSANVGPAGAWRDVLTIVRRSKQQVTFRATATGKGVIILTPKARKGECISCATRHYLVEVVSPRRPN